MRSVSCRDAGWESALAERPLDLVAVWGGDGTVGRVAQRMARRGVPLAAIAAGTANNIALTLGVESLSVEAQVDGWRTARRLGFDVAVARGPWGTERLIEGVGCGLLASTIRRADDAEDEMRKLEPAQRLARSLQVLKERVGAFPTTRVHATLDGRDISGDYVLFEAMNTQFVGPNLNLAPKGRPDDGELDVVFATDADRDRLRDQLAIWQRGAIATAAPLECVRGRALTLAWNGYDIHVDDRLPVGRWRYDSSCCPRRERLSRLRQPHATGCGRSGATARTSARKRGSTCASSRGRSSSSCLRSRAVPHATCRYIGRAGAVDPEHPAVAVPDRHAFRRALCRSGAPHPG